MKECLRWEENQKSNFVKKVAKLYVYQFNQKGLCIIHGSFN